MVGEPGGSTTPRRGILQRSRNRLVGWRLGLLAGRGLPPVLFGNAVEVHAGGDATFARIEEAIASARESLAIEMYTWSDDRLGRRIADLVAERARGGLTVLVLLDAFGSLGSGALAARLLAAGVRVLWYHRLFARARRYTWNRRNHRKLVLVDGRLAITGGVNLSASFSREFSGEEAWRDLSVAVRGPAVRELTRLFIGSWLSAGGAVDETAPLIAQPSDEGTAGVQVAGGRRLFARRRLRTVHLVQIALATQRIVIANAYFAPERPLLSALCRAARRGVAVELLLAGRSDSAPVRWAGRASYDALLDAGVLIREVHHAVLHAKVAVFDDETLLTGSANLDYRSFRHNIEVAIGVFDPDAARAALDALAPEVAAAVPIERDAWRRRGWPHRLMERLATLVKYWL